MNDRNVAIAGTASRILVVLLGCVLPSLAFVPKVNTPVEMAKTVAGAPPVLEPWYRWDAAWYATISREGYHAAPRGEYSSLTFLPLLPMVMAAGAAAGLDRFWVGLIVPNIAFVVALVCFARIAVRLTGSEDVAWRSSLLLIAYPWSYYFSAPYQESLGFLLSTLAVLAWMNHRPVASGVAAALAPTARLTATAFSVSLVAEWLVDRVRGRPARWAAWPVAVAGGIGLLMFYTYLHFRVGNFFASLQAQEAWGRQPPGFGPLLQALTRPPRSLSGLKDYVVGLGFLAVGLVALRRRGVFWAGMIIFPVLQPMSSGTALSATRLALMSYPAFIEVADLVRNRYAFAALLAAGAAVQVLMLKGFVS